MVTENVKFLSKSTQDESKSVSGVNTHQGNKNHSEGFFKDDCREMEDNKKSLFN